jgi:hypothetical protein
VRRILAMVTVLPVRLRAAGGAERDDGRWFDQVALVFEPDLAAFDLVTVRPLMQAPFAAHLMFEMLDCIGDEGVLAGDAGIFERGVENAAGRPDERLAGEIFLVARLLADQHEIGFGRTFPRHGLSGVAIKRTSVALALGRGESGQRPDWFAVWLVHVVVHLGKMPNRRKRSCGAYGPLW